MDAFYFGVFILDTFLTLFYLGSRTGPVVNGMGLGGVERYGAISFIASICSVTVELNIPIEVMTYKVDFLIGPKIDLSLGT